MRQELPASFLASMEELIGEELSSYLDSYHKECFNGLRVNDSKVDPGRFAVLSGFTLKSVPWVENGFYYQGEERPSKHPYYYAGLYYLQEPSAMTPASLLPVKPGDMVLDLCAAPGGKSTELGVKLKGKGMLVANDISNSRAKALLKNLELFGIPNMCVTSEEPKKLALAFPEFFDKILVDAPCSGEGMFRRDKDMVKSWMEHGPEYYAPIQKEIAAQAISMLKPGGMLLYSTCTFSSMEDEGVIQELLEVGMELVSLPLFEGAVTGKELPGVIRLFPHKIDGEGHFIALLKKPGGENTGAAGTNMPGNFGVALSAAEKVAVDCILGLCRNKFDQERIRVYQDKGTGNSKGSADGSMVYYVPEGFHPKISLRYLRTGLLLGSLKKGRFEPSQALAMTLCQESFKNSVSFKVGDERVIRYLKGETIFLEPDEEFNGWCLVCVDGFALGFAKGTGTMLKNKYYPGWRWQ